MTIDPQRRRVRVATSCTREQVQEIRIHAGDALAVGHRNQQHPAFIWSATEDGHHGWVPEEFIEIVGGHNAVARRDYDSTHLTVIKGETLEVVEQVGGYLLCRNVAGVEGWVPESCAEETVEGT
jgi:Variant SH3 domain